MSGPWKAISSTRPGKKYEICGPPTKSGCPDAERAPEAMRMLLAWFGVTPAADAALPGSFGPRAVIAAVLDTDDALARRRLGVVRRHIAQRRGRVRIKAAAQVLEDVHAPG
jgi:hypothetical protein